MSANTRLSEQDRQILKLSKLSHEAHELIVKEARSSYSISLLMMALQLFKENKLRSTSLNATQDTRTTEERQAAFKKELWYLGEKLCFEQLWFKLSPRVRNKLYILKRASNPLQSFLRRSESDLRGLGIGDLDMLEINGVLDSYGLTMGMSKEDVKKIFKVLTQHSMEMDD